MKKLGLKEISYCDSVKVKVLVAQSCSTLCNPMGCSPPGSFVHGILQARILEWFAIPFPRRSSWTRDQTRMHCRRILYHLSHWESDSVNICQSQDSNPFYFHSKTLIFLLYHAHWCLVVVVTVKRESDPPYYSIYMNMLPYKANRIFQMCLS